MHQHHIEEMADALIDAGLIIGTPDVQKTNMRPLIIQTLQGLWKDKIAITWDANDVRDFALSDMQRALSDDETRQVLGFLMDEHDATLGVNWDTISDTIYYHKLGTELPEGEGV